MTVLVVDPAEGLADVGIGLWASRLPEPPNLQAQRPDIEPAWTAPVRAIVTTLGRRTGEQLRSFRETADYSGGRSLIHHLADPDWKPSTATPESCRWEYEPAPTNFWGTPPLGLRFRF